MLARGKEVVDVSTCAQPVEALLQAVSRAAPGVQVIYARDWFLADAMLANTARALFEDGQVDLVQRRIKVGRNDKFAYIAIKRKETMPTRAAVSDLS